MTDTIGIYRLIQTVIKGGLEVDALIGQLKEFSETLDEKDEIIDAIADAISLNDAENNVCDKELKLRERLLAVIKALHSSQLLPIEIAQERLDVDTLGQVNLINDKKQFSTSYVRLRTKLYFTQIKYNLLKEQIAGYSKILTELYRLDQNNIHEVLATIVKIVGSYRADPNRVLDLIVEVFLHNVFGENPNDLYIEFINLFYDDKPKLLQLLQLRLSFYAGKNNEVLVVPQGFYRVLAFLINKGIYDIDDFYNYLYPHDAKVLEYHKKLVEEAKHAARKYAIAVVGEEKPVKSVIDMLKEASPIEYHYLEVDNQKVNLCAHLIDLGDWDQALQIAQKLPEYHCFSNRRVALASCALLSHIIDPLYRECALPRPLNLRLKPVCLFDVSKVPQITSIDELSSRVFPILEALGPFLSYDTLTLVKIIRVVRYALLFKPDDNTPDTLTAEGPLYYQITDIIAYSILPSISLSGGNSSLARESWNLIKNLKPQTRYKLYYEWRDEGSNPIMLKNKGQILLRAKHHMKRLSKETLRQCGRHLGKLCYSNPVITLNYVLTHIQSYDNLIALVVDALRYLPPIALDVLIYCVIEALSDPNKNKKSPDGMALAQWLTNLSTFTSSVILRYKVEFSCFLEYISNQLKIGNSLDLVLLADLIQKMTGIEAIQAITDDRIEALMGGHVLRTEGAYFNQVKNTRKSSARLKDALIESRLAMPLCILMAQLRDRLCFSQHDTGTPLKLVGKLYDQCQETLAQYGVFMSMNLSINDYVNFMPPLERLMTEHKLDADTAFFLARPMIFHKIKSTFHELKTAAEKEVIAEEGESPELSPQALSIKFVEAARSVLDPIAETIQPILAEKYVSCNLNSKLFVIFWTLSMSDIEVPLKCYEREIARLNQTVMELSKFGDEDQKKRKERERCAALVAKLKQEQADQIEHTNYIKMYLESERKNLFCENSYDNVYIESRQFVQHCPFARCIQTACDAIYSARFMLFLHELKVENYPTIICLDRLLCDLTYMMGACTENEANHYGRFLCNILKTTSQWHSSAQVYTEQCEQYPGSIINIDNSEYINYETYRDICYKWHYRLTRSFSVALESNNYIQIRNALIVMISIIDYYPAIKHFGKGIGIKIEEVRTNEKENRQDLYALATAYAGRLDEIRSRMIPESNFHTVSDSRGSQKRDSSSSSNSRKKTRH
uniref:THO complex subunit 2 n=1 Tax=Aceria tosichella TaxID=561515 RepID=A0A6G1S584_9ACAR